MEGTVEKKGGRGLPQTDFRGRVFASLLWKLSIFLERELNSAQKPEAVYFVLCSFLKKKKKLLLLGLLVNSF